MEDLIVPIDTPHKISVEKITIPQEFYDKMKYGEYTHTQGNRLLMFFENNWLYIHSFMGGIGLYKTELKQENGEYYIDEFFVEGNKEKLIKGLSFESDTENVRHFQYLIYKAHKTFC